MSFVKLSRIPPKFKYFRPIRAIDDTKITKPFLKKINLKPVKSIAFSFNPFFGRTESIRKASLLISHPKWRATNPGVLTKTTVKSDCSPPLMEILYGNGNIVSMKTENLSLREIVEIMIDSSESTSASDDEGWDEIEPDGNRTPEQFFCLVCPLDLPNSETFFKHLGSHSTWDELLRPGKGLINDQYDWIRFVNYVRLKRPTDWHQVFDDICWKEKSDELLRPVLDNDAVLTIDMESILESQNLGSDAKAPRMETKSSGAGLKSGDADEITRLEADNLALREELATCRRLLSSLVEHSPISENLPHSPQPGSDPASEDIVQNRDPDPYFDSYGHFAIHGEMLTDHIRTDSYRNFILSNSKPYFAGKCVLDVGCGTGILSLFAKEAGAAKVFGVEASAEIFAAAQETLRVNNLDDRITLIRDRVETVQLPVDQVDVIISEWMGYFLFFESMLDSVIIAARRFLSPDTGRIFPRHYSLHLTGISCGTKLRHDYLDLWTNTYGYQMPALRRAALAEAHVLDLTDLNVVGEESSQGYRILTSSSCELYSLDIDSFWKDTSCTLPHQVGCCPFSLLIDAPECFNLDAFVGYFDVRFDDEAPSRVCFSTSPATPTTHWKQVVFFLDKPLIVNKGDKLTGSLDILRARYDARGLEIRLHVDPPNDQLPVEQTYFLLS